MKSPVWIYRLLCTSCACSNRRVGNGDGSASQLRVRGSIVAAAWGAVLVCAFAARAADHFAMAPLALYMMDRNAEIALAQSAAPPSVSRDAAILVFTAHGYETAVAGNNGFTCIVERGWTPPFDLRDFWNPRIRAPICYNAAASRSVLQYALLKTKLALAGLTRTQILARVKATALPTPEPGSMSYMLSKQQYLGDEVGSWYPHVMFHLSKADGANHGASWGADLPGSPIVVDKDHHLVPEPETIFMIPVSKWSDGSNAPPE